MKVKTSVLLPKELLQTVDHYSEAYSSRSAFVEQALRAFIAKLVHDEQNAKDLDILNRCADELNQETMDALTYQVPV
jgi:metal-responsive CopG/Arc/MetJ family transcriptional regulator